MASAFYTRSLKRKTDYKPPAEMRISHATRVYFATSYYTKTIFHVKGVDALDTWLNSISYNDAKNIRTIHFEAEAEVKRLQASMVSIGLQPASEDFATAMYLRLLLDRDLRNKIASFKAVMHCKVEGRKGEEWHRAGEIFDRNGFVTSVS